MPTVMIINGLKFYFYSNEGSRIHVHIKNGSAEVKIWLDTFEIANSKGFNLKEKFLAVKLARKYEKEIKDKWTEYFKIKA